MILRDYQQASVDAAMAHLRHSVEPIVLDQATGAGKSHVIAAMAHELNTISEGKSVLVLAPSKELVEQDAEKYSRLGRDFSYYSASVGEKCLEHEVVFGSPVSVRNGIESLARKRWAAVIIDECHGVTPTIKGIVEALRASNTNLRVIGLSATPYRLGAGYIYRQDPSGAVMSEQLATDPYFVKCVHKVGAHELVAGGYLTPPVIGEPGAAYDASKLVLNKMGKFDSKEVEKAFNGKERLTNRIMDEIRTLAADRHGVLVFAATVRHAEECLRCLPPEQSSIITGKTPKKERADLLRRFAAKEIKFVVNVSVLTTGFDAPHVDLIAILRKTESVGLLQQIVGRGTRVDEGKHDFLVMDYAGNIETHCPKGDIFDPRIQAHQSVPGETIEIRCPTCDSTNVVMLKKEFSDARHDAAGYYLAENGKRHVTELGDPIPVHSSRRCSHEIAGVRCTQAFVWKTCPQCQVHNDPTARYCKGCKVELVDPNKKLSMGKRPEKITEEVISIDVGGRFMTKQGFLARSVSVATTTLRFRSVLFESGASRQPWIPKSYKFHIDHIRAKPKTITYARKQNGRYQIYDYNQKVTA